MPYRRPSTTSKTDTAQLPCSAKLCACYCLGANNADDKGYAQRPVAEFNADPSSSTDCVSIEADSSEEDDNSSGERGLMVLASH